MTRGYIRYVGMRADFVWSCATTRCSFQVGHRAGWFANAASDLLLCDLDTSGLLEAVSI